MGLIPIFSIFLISVIVITSQSGQAFAETQVLIAGGSSVPGCEETNQCFIPYQVTIDVGDNVVWVNMDSAAHTITTGTVSGGPDGDLDVFLQVNDALDATFPKSGTFDYFCMVHPWMTGKVVVKGQSTSQISGTPTIEAIEILGYDARDVPELIAHNGAQMIAYSGGVLDGYKRADERVSVFVTNDSVRKITIAELWFAGTIYRFSPNNSHLDSFNGNAPGQGEFSILTNSPGTLLSAYSAEIQPGQTVTIVIDLNDNITIGRDSQFKLITTNGNVVVATVIIGQTTENVPYNLPSGTQISGTPTLEAIRIVGFDARDTAVLEVHDGSLMNTPDSGGIGDSSKNKGERIAVYVHNDSVQKITIAEIDFAGSTYHYNTNQPGAWNDPFFGSGSYGIITSTSSGFDQMLTTSSPEIQAGQTVTVLLDMYRSFALGNDVRFLLKTTNGNVVVSTIAIGQQSEGRSVSYTSPSSSPGVAPAGTDIKIISGSSVPGCERSNSCYLPYTYKADVGETVTWFNQDSAVHTVTSGSISSGGVDGKFDSSLFMAGSTFSHKFTSSGTFDYFCMVHPWMTGEVKVGSSSTSSTSTSSSTSTKLKVPIVVTTDKSSYSLGDSLQISGQIKDVMRGFPVTLSIISPDGNQIFSFDVEVTKNREFSAGMLIDGYLLQKSGEYTVKATYGTEFRMAQTTFDFTIPEKTSKPQTSESQFRAYASEADVVIASGSSAPGCEETSVCYEPDWVHVELGEEITWYNGDSAAHTITSGIPSKGPDGLFDSKLIMAGETFSHTFTEPHNSSYYCMIHPWMQGLVIVNSPPVDITKDSNKLPTIDDFVAYLPTSNIFPTSLLKYKLVFVNSVDDKCSERNYQTMYFLNTVTDYYLSFYDVEHHATTPTCLTVNDFNKIADFVEREELELIILIADWQLSEDHLKDSESPSWGYSWQRGEVHLIVVNSITPFTKSASVAWTLSHELSHFVLIDKYGQNSEEAKWVHFIDRQMDYCREQSSGYDDFLYNDSQYGSMKGCPPSLFIAAHIDGNSVYLMEPYDEDDHLQYDTRTTLTLNPLPISVYEGQKITFRGSLMTLTCTVEADKAEKCERSIYNDKSEPVSNVKIYFKQHDLLTQETLGSLKTDENGQFRGTWNAENNNPFDSYIQVSASYEDAEGNYRYQKSKSSINQILIK